MVVKNTLCSSGTYVMKNNKFTSKLAKIVEALTREEPRQGMDIAIVLKVNQQA